MNICLTAGMYTWYEIPTLISNLDEYQEVESLHACVMPGIGQHDPYRWSIGFGRR